VNAIAEPDRHAHPTLNRKVYELVAVRIPRAANTAWDWAEKNTGLTVLMILVLDTLTAGLILAHLTAVVGALVAGLVIGSLVTYAAMRVAGAHQREKIAELERLNAGLTVRVVPPVEGPHDGPTRPVGIEALNEALRRRDGCR
jgi:hypothetical protein